MKAVTALAFLSLGACATVRTPMPVYHTPEQLAVVGKGCGLALGELMQDREEEALLFLMRDTPTQAESDCVHRFAQANDLHVVFLEGVTFE